MSSTEFERAVDAELRKRGAPENLASLSTEELLALKAQLVLASRASAPADASPAVEPSPSSSSSASGISVDGIEAAMEFLHTVSRLKHAPRQGWLDRGVSERRTESVAAHMYRMAVLCSLCPDATLDRSRMVRIALAHDMPEAIVGDVSPAMMVPKDVKRAAEARAMEQQLGPLLSAAGADTTTDPTGTPELVAAWREYEDHETAESKFVHDVDSLEMVLQAYEYETELGQRSATNGHSRSNVDLSGFFGAVQKIRHPWLRAMGDRVLERREQRMLAQSIAPAPLGVPGAPGAAAAPREGHIPALIFC